VPIGLENAVREPAEQWTTPAPRTLQVFFVTKRCHIEQPDEQGVTASRWRCRQLRCVPVPGRELAVKEVVT
jgi:hypothetical protein